MSAKYYNNNQDTTNFSDTECNLFLSANTVVSYTVPDNNGLPVQALFSYASNSNVFVGYNVVPVIPTVNVPNTTSGEEYKPIKRFVNGGDVLNFISPDAATYMGVSFRSL